MSRKSEPTFTSLLRAAHEFADLSGAAIMPHFRTALAVDDKGPHGWFDPVTAADRAAEEAISRALSERFPDHGLEGEEFGSRNDAAAYRWVVDPIDGTRAFITGMPLWGTLIGLLHQDRALLGLMDQPYTGERFWSEAEASYMSNRRDARPRKQQLKTRACARLEDAVLATTHPDLFKEGIERQGFERVKARARMSRYGGDCYIYCMLAAGLIDVIIEVGLKPHDIVALVPIIERAGGRVTTWDGGPAEAGGRILACGDEALHTEVLRLVGG